MRCLWKYSMIILNKTQAEAVEMSNCLGSNLVLEFRCGCVCVVVKDRV